MKKLIVFIALLCAACATAPPPTAPAPAPVPVPAPQPKEEAVIGTAHVTTQTLNVRSAPSLDGEIVTHVKKGDKVSMLESGENWIRVRIDDGTIGWVSRPLVAIDGQKAVKVAKKNSCPADSDFQFANGPKPSFSENGAHGIVVIDVNVNTKGDVMSTKVLSNSTGDEALAFLAEREMKATKFIAPIRNCISRAFIFTYKRTF